MPNRYWVGGTASWDGVAGTKWSATSGGPGGASVPTSVDDVFFDENSGSNNITIALYGVAYDGQRYVVGGDSGIVSQSTNTIKWSGVDYGTTNFIREIVYNNSLFVSVGGAGTIRTSPDGITWTGRTSGTANNLSSAIWTGTQFVAVGASGTILTSPNGITWTVISSGTTTFLSDIAWNGSLLVVVGLSGLIRTSPDGINWTARTSNTTNPLNGVTWTGTQFVAVGGTGTIRTSPDGINWTTRNSGTTAPLGSVDSSGSVIVATATTGTAVRISSDGASWSGQATGSTSTLRAVRWVNSQFVAVGDAGNIVLSSDGITWVRRGSVSCNISSGNLGAKSITYTGFNGTITGTGSITISGNVTLDPDMIYLHATTVTFNNVSKLITSGKTFSPGIIIVGASTILTLGDALNIGVGNLVVTEGKFDTGNYNLTANAIQSSNSNIREIVLGSSNVTLNSSDSPIDFSTSTNLVFDAGTSQINLTSPSAVLVGGSKSFNNVSFTSSTIGIRSISGSNTFNNITNTASAIGLTLLQFSDDQVITGTLTCQGASTRARNFILSSNYGTPVTLQVASLNASNCDFRDITITGPAENTNPTSAGNCGGNSGVVFSAPKTVYRVGTDNTWYGSNSWALASGSTGSNLNYPLPQDIAIIDQATTGTNISITSGTPVANICSLDCSQRSSAFTLNFAATNRMQGSLILGPGITITGTAQQNFLGRNSTFINPDGKTITFPITINTVSGIVSLLGALSCTGLISLISGTFDASSYNVTCPGFSSLAAVTRSLNMGSALWTLTGTGIVWNIADTGLSINKQSANILLSSSSSAGRTFTTGGFAYNKLTIGGTSTSSTLTLGGANGSFTEIDSIRTTPHTIRLLANMGTIGTWSVRGTPGNLVVLSTVTGIRTFSLSNVTSGIDYLQVSNIQVNEPNRFYVGTNSVDLGNNVNVIFADAPILTQENGNFLMVFI